MTNRYYESLKYQWGGRDPQIGLDCISGASYVRQRLLGVGINLETPKIAEIFQRWPTEELMPARYPFELTRELCSPREAPEVGDLIVLNMLGKACMGLVLPGREAGFMSMAGGLTYPLSRMAGHVMGIFDPSQILTVE